MNESTPPDSEPLVTPLEARILGSLMEKERTTPEHYPLTLSSLVAACCQKSNRNPVAEFRTRVPRMVPTLTDGQVEAALEVLREVKRGGLVSELPKAPGRREIRFAEILGGGIPEDSPGRGHVVVIEAPTTSEEKRIGELETRVAESEETLETRVAESEETLETLNAGLREFRASFEHQRGDFFVIPGRRERQLGQAHA